LKNSCQPIKRSRRSCDCKIIAETGASIASMGKVMGLASAQLGGTAEGKQFLQ
jgi:uncharacterized protein YqeY